MEELPDSLNVCENAKAPNGQGGYSFVFEKTKSHIECIKGRTLFY